MAAPTPPSETLFITDLPPTIDEATLTKVFGSYGTIKSSKLFPPSQRGQGNAIISFGSIEEAKWLVENLSGNIPQGLDQAVTVNYKTENWKKAAGVAGKGGWGGGGGADSWGGGGSWGQGAGGGGGGAWGQGGGGAAWGQGGGGGKGAAAADPNETLFIGDLPGDMTDEKLKAVFGEYGTIKSHKILPPGSSGKLAAIISFDSVEGAKWIVENLNGNIPQGLTEAIQVNYKTENWKKAAGMGGKGGWGGDGGMDSWGGKGGGASWGQGGGGGGWGGGGKGGGAADAQPSETLFVGDLPPDMNDVTLKTVFGEYGTIVSHKILPPGTSGKPAAIISFGSVEGAKWIVENLNGNIPQGLTEPITVKYKTPNKKFQNAWGAPPKDESWTPPAAWANSATKATPQTGTWGAAPTGPSGPTPKVDPSQAVFVGDLPPEIDEATLQTVFGAYCTVVSVKILPPNASGASAIVNMSSTEEANWCAENMNDQIPQGLSKPIKCRLKTPKADGGKGWGGKGWGPY